MTATMMTASDEDWSQLTWEEELYHGYPDHDDESNNDLVVDRLFTIDDDWMTGGATRPGQDQNDDTDDDAGRQTRTQAIGQMGPITATLWLLTATG